MIEPVMYFGIGFLVASLFGLVVVPLVHNRAVRLTMRRLEAATPLSMAEIQADKDQLRAEFAMSTRRLEMSVEQIKARATSQLAELGKKNEAINRLKVELGEKTATIFALEARERSLKEQLGRTEEEFSIKTNAMHEAERALADKQAELKKVTADLDRRSVDADSQRIELVAIRTQADALKQRLDDAEREMRETEERLHRERADAGVATKELADERGKAENLGNRVAELERQLVAQTTEAEILGRRVQEQEALLAEQGRMLAEREYDCDRLRAELETAKRTEIDLRSEMAEVENRVRSTSDSLRTEKSSLESQLEAVKEERTKLQQEIAVMKREAETTWATERVENALLRERINDIAAEIARLTMAIEGPNSPIEAILAADKSPGHGAPANGDSGQASNLADEEGSGSLADRIRALQTRTSRASSTN
jgi:chromosome segregation ATPase